MTYHHGDLRRAILAAAVETITEHGPAGVSLRDLARRAGVSHAAPAHHFVDKAGLLTALAVQGFEALTAALDDEPPGDLLEVGARYVRFAVTHPAHFDVMFQPDLVHRDAPELAAARERTGRALRRAVGGGRGVPEADDPGGADEPEGRWVAAWAVAHGFATLWRTGNLDRSKDTLSPSGDIGEAFRAVAAGRLTR